MSNLRPDPESNLKYGGAIFALTWMLHTADHIRRTAALTSDGVLWAGTSAAAVAAVALTLIFTDHETAPFAALAAFGSVAIGTAATHLAPAWGYFSEPLLFRSATDNWALAAAVPEIAAATWLAWKGFQIVRANDYQLVSSKPDKLAHS